MKEWVVKQEDSIVGCHVSSFGFIAYTCIVVGRLICTHRLLNVGHPVIDVHLNLYTIHINILYM